MSTGDRESTWYEPSNELLEVLCINCNRMIDADILEIHSRVWGSVSTDVKQLETMDELDLHLK